MPVAPLVAAGHRSGCGCHCRPCWAFTVIHLRSFVGCWPLVAGCCPLCAQLSRCWGVVVVWAAGVVCGGVSHVTWHAGDMDSACFVVDVGDMGMWCCVLFTGSCYGSLIAGVVRGGGGHLWHHGGRAESRWWLWDEERRHVTICDACDFGSTFECACAQSRSCPNL